MKRLFLLTLLIQLVCIAALLLVRSVFADVGTLLTRQMRADTEFIDQMWCWRELCPGKTLTPTVKAQLATSAVDVITQTDVGMATELRWESRANPTWYSTVKVTDATVNVIHVYMPSDGLVLGDVIAHLGRPSFTYSQLTVYQKNSVLVLNLATFICFEGGLCAAVSPDGCNSWTRYEANMPIRELFLYPSRWAREQFGVISPWTSLGRQYVRCPVVLN